MSTRPVTAASRAIVAGVMVAVGILAGGIGIAIGINDEVPGFSTLTGQAPDPADDLTFTLRGTLSVTCSGSCLGYGDIQDGGQVEIVNEQHRVLAVTTLGSIANDAGYGRARSYQFAAADVPRGEKLYGVKIGNADRGVIWKSESEAAAEGFALTLG
jgi:hypothetical protein